MSAIFNQDREVRTAPYTFKLILPETYIGVELELENCSYQTSVNLGLWHRKHDGSLRDAGSEFVMGFGHAVTPLRGMDVITALNMIQSYFDDMPDAFKPSISKRCSTHIHMDVRDMEDDAFAVLLMLYARYEDDLIRFYAPERMDNHYCRRASEIPYAQDRLSRLSNGVDKYLIDDICSNGDKYTACNWKSVAQRGSLEFRFFPGTIYMDNVLEWINVLQAFKYHAMKYKTLDVDLQDIIGIHPQIIDMADEIHVIGSGNSYLLSQDGTTYIPEPEHSIFNLETYKSIHFGE